jgi:translation elongation factor EF-G
LVLAANQGVCSYTPLSAFCSFTFLYFFTSHAYALFSILCIGISCLLTTLSHHHTYTRSNRNEFVNGLSGNNVPPEYIPAIEKGFAEACQQGASVGAPLQGVRFVVTDGAAHSVDR